jgi:hypothetical protein
MAQAVMIPSKIKRSTVRLCILLPFGTPTSATSTQARHQNRVLMHLVPETAMKG